VQGLDLRDAVSGVVVLAKRDLGALWRQVADAEQAQVVLNDILPGLITAYGAAAATLAAEWYDDARDKAGVGGTFSALAADTPEAGAPALVGWALTEAADYESFQTLIAGGMQRRIMNFSRTTITGSAVADPKAIGWQRVGNGNCPFCRSHIHRATVYRETTANFAAHDHCGCSAAPAWVGREPPVMRRASRLP
jgi:hypothetical protein